MAIIDRFLESWFGSRFVHRKLASGLFRHHLLVVAASLLVILYSFSVLWVVATSGDIGIRCIFGSAQKEPIPAHAVWYDAEQGRSGRLVPEEGDTFTKIADRDGSWSEPIAEGDYTAVIRAQRKIGQSRRGREILVEWRPEGAADDAPPRSAVAIVQWRPFGTYVWSLVWFAQEIVIFAIGLIVLWRRPNDPSARVFFWLSFATVGAYMGGYHWSEIVIARPLIFLFAPFAMAVPVVSLHFFLVFPRPHPVLLLHRRAVPRLLYGVPALCLATLWGAMLWLTFTGEPPPAGALEPRDVGRRLVAQGVVESVALGYVAYSVLIFGLCVACLVSNYRRARGPAERNQVRWILLASMISSVLIGYLMWWTLDDTATLGLDEAAWPMYAVSLLYSSAYAVSITRYKLMRAEEIFNRSVRYLLVSVGLGLAYSMLLVLGSFAAIYTLQDDQTSREATVVTVTALVILVLSGGVHRRFEQAIDRRFFREKRKFDQAMRKMSQAVDRLVDPGALGRRLLEAAAEVLGLDWGSIYLRRGAGRPLSVVACLGPEPERTSLAEDNPVVRRLAEQPTVRLPGAIGRSAADPVADALIALGVEIAAALNSEEELAGVLVLGPKRNGLPYDDEEQAFLAALASVAAMALHSASIHRTLEELNRELRDKVEKIAEQQRRILILQDQLVGSDRSAADGDGPGRPEGPDPEAIARIRGSSPAVRRMLDTVRKAAASPSAVLVLGESGTGKELVAEAIHAASHRADGPFVRVHCGALAPGLLESELFGHVRGAFTGADRDRLGRFQQADGGTLMLDEIGDIGPDVQTKLLRVLQTKSFERVGSSQPITVDVRIVAATHRDLAALIRAGRFREDLFYRLNVISIRTPPLRERRGDVFELAVTFLRRPRRAFRQADHPAGGRRRRGPDRLRLAGQRPRVGERRRTRRRVRRGAVDHPGRPPRRSLRARCPVPSEAPRLGPNPGGAGASPEADRPLVGGPGPVLRHGGRGLRAPAAPRGPRRRRRQQERGGTAPRPAPEHPREQAQEARRDRLPVDRPLSVATLRLRVSSGLLLTPPAR